MLDKDVLSKVLASARSYQQLQSVDYTTEVVPPRGKGVGPLISLHRFWGAGHPPPPLEPMDKHKLTGADFWERGRCEPRAANTRSR